jgi:multiple sugar transport system permease protein
MISLEKIRSNEARGAKAGPLAQKEERAAYLFLLPWLAGLLLFLVIPVIASLGLSFSIPSA